MILDPQTEQIALQESKVMPLCMAAEKWPSLLHLLQREEEKKSRINNQQKDIYVALRDISCNDYYTEREKYIVSLFAEPKSLEMVKAQTGELLLASHLERLLFEGAMIRVGLTPTDAMHYKGDFTAYNSDASALGLRIMARMVGNTTMSHLVFGVTPASMARTPFAPVFAEAQDERADELGLSIYTHANVRLLPNIAGHVGSDIVGMMMAAGLDRCKGAHIAIDIGTNGEVVAVKNERMLCCSTAAGPAFEGATIRQGMRAAAGAIEGVVIDGSGVHLKTIDDAPAIGICGSGLIDAVSELLRVGVVDVSGRMLTKAQAQSAGVPERIADCIVGEGVDAYFLLSEAEDREPIILTQSDIREVQLAKGAILAGIQTLMAELQMSVDEIESIMLAGAFGNYINKRSALGIGLLPQVKEEKILAIGNAAGVGACMALLSDAERGRADLLALSTEHIELSMNPTFQDYYIDAMTFR